MSNIHLKVNQNFIFMGLKNLSPGQLSGAPTHADIIEILLQLKNLKSGSKTASGFSIVLILK